jgi:hypothetical protein
VRTTPHVPGNDPETLVLYRKRTGATGSVGLDLRSSLSIQPFEGSRFVRGGRYGISIDFGLEVVENKSTCGASFKSKFIDLTMKPRLTIASSQRETDHSSRLGTLTLVIYSYARLESPMPLASSTR